jgi:peroxiredoxin
MAGQGWHPAAPSTGEQADDLDVLDEGARPVVLSSLARGAPLLVLVFRDPYDDGSMRLLLDYRDSTLALKRAGVFICAIGKDDPGRLAYLRRERGLGFPVLADPDGVALSRWGMIDRVGVFLLDSNFHVRQRALGGRVSAEAMLSFVKRGGARAPRIGIGDRVRIFWHSLQHALRPRKLVR